METFLLLLLVTVAVSATIEDASNSTADGIEASDATNVVFGGSRLFGYNAFLPSPPGKRPPCAASSDTYCEHIDQYPGDLIDFLLRRYGYDFNTLILDETADTVQLDLSPATPYSPSPIYVPSINTTVPLHTFVGSDTLGHDTPFIFPYVGPYLYQGLNDPWWFRYLRSPVKSKEHASTTNYRVLRQTPAGSAAPSQEAEPLCPTVSQFIVPRAALNTKGNWMFVVNQESSTPVTQLVRSERCTTTKCSGLCQIPAGFTSTCQQQFVQKRLVALSANGQNLYTDTFWFPHCCICQITSNSSPSNNNNNN